MNVLMVDDETGALEILDRAVKQAVPDATVRGFSRAADALETVRRREFLPDVAFLDVHMPEMTGLELGIRLRELNSHTNIIFVTAYTEFALAAIDMYASGYILKPVTAERVSMELDNLRYPVEKRSGNIIRVQCFGNFEIFANGQPLDLYYDKSRELIAYLVDRRGAACNTAELCAVLWEDEPDSMILHKRLRKLISDLTHALEGVGAEDVFLKRRNSFAVATSKIDCDYYGLLNRDTTAINTYTGEYMSQYSWAEITLGSLENRD